MLFEPVFTKLSGKISWLWLNTWGTEERWTTSLGATARFALSLIPSPACRVSLTKGSKRVKECGKTDACARGKPRIVPGSGQCQ
jgi:hypothetical protein